MRWKQSAEGNAVRASGAAAGLLAWVIVAGAAGGASGSASAPPPAAAEKPPTILDVALLAAERQAINRMRGEENLTWQSTQLSALTRLLARAGRYDDALRLIRDLDTPERVKAPAFAPIAVAAYRRGDRERARDVVKKLAAMEEWTTPGALAEVARAMDQAGEREEAARLVATMPAGAERADAFLAMKRYSEALQAARDIPPGQIHVPCGRERTCWIYEYSGRQQFRFELIEKLVDAGDLGQARTAIEELDEESDGDAELWRARALAEIARREDPKSTLQLALDALGRHFVGNPGDRVDRAQLRAEIAEQLAAAGDRTRAGEQLAEALAEIGPIDSVDEVWLHVTQIAEAVPRIARAHLALGQRAEALSLLARTERLVDGWPVRARDKRLSFDNQASEQQDRVEAKLRVAAALESAGEVERGQKVLASALAELAKIRSAEWRGYGWRSLIDAYREVGRLDRAIEILTSGPRADADKQLAVQTLTVEDFLAAPRTQLWGLLDALPPGGTKTAQAAILAARLAAQGEDATATRLVSEALESLAAMAAKREPDWILSLIELGGEAPNAERAGNAEQQRWLREILAALPAKPTKVAAKPR